MTQDQLDALARGHEAWFAGRGGSRLELRGVDLSGLSLAGRGLHECRLNDVNLSKANLRGAAFLRAELTDARFLRAAGEGARFSDATLRGCSFDGAALQGAAFDGARATACSFEGAAMAEAILVKADFTDVRLDHSDLRSANGLRLHMRGGSLASARLVEADFRRALFLGVDFQHADVTNAALDAAHFKQVRVFGMVGRPALLGQSTAEAVDFGRPGAGGDVRTGDEFLAWLDADHEGGPHQAAATV